MADIHFKNGDGKIVGTLHGSVYISHRNKKHFMVMFKGFGVSVSLLEELKSLSCDTVRIVYEGATKKIYDSDLDDWLNSTKEYNYLGTDLQKFISISDMRNI